MKPHLLSFAMLIGMPFIFAAEEPPTIKTYGNGSVSMKPDQATVSIGVVTQADTADAAAAQNAKQLTAVLDQLHKDLGAKADIRTSGYSLFPNYKPRPLTPGNNTPNEITGYTVRNTVQAKVDDLSKLGSVIDGATQAGSNSISGIQFGLKNEQPALAAAIKQAAQIARSNADAMASALGLRVIRVRSAESTGGRLGPLPQAEMRNMAGTLMDTRAPTPIESGLQFTAQVTLILDVER